MAVIWTKKQNGNIYEVRSAGASRRLYTNRVCHSQFNPKQVLTGSIWDLLLLPAWFHPTEKIRRVLVLGVGGGAVLRLIQTFFSPKAIVGVELDEMHLSIARRFFQLDHPSFDLVQADAKEWVENYEGEPFDLVIEDLFSESKGQPVRALAANSVWYQQLLSLMRRDAVLTMNFASTSEFRQSAAVRQKTTNHRFKTIFQLTMPTLDNSVGVYLIQEAESNDLHKRINEVAELRRALQSKRLRYRIRKQRRL